MSERSIPERLEQTVAVFDDEQPGVPLTTSEVTEYFDVSRRSVYERLRELAEMNRLQTKKVGARGRIWWRPPEHASQKNSEGEAATESRPDAETQEHRDDRNPELSAVFDGIDEAVFALDSADRFTLVNDAFCTLTGYDREALLGARAEMVVPDDGSGPMESQVVADESGPTDRRELRIVTRTGEQIPCETSLSRVRFADGAVGQCGVIRDIAGRKRDEQAVTRFKRAIEAAGHAIFMTDLNGEITYANSSVEAVTGYEASALLGKSPSVLLSSETSQDTYFWQGVEPGQTTSGERRCERKDGTTYWAEQTIAPVTDETGTVVEYVVSQTDITDRKRVTQRLTDLNDALKNLLAVEAPHDIASVLVDTVTAILDLPACVVYQHDELAGQLVPLTEASESGFIEGELASVPATTGFLGTVFTSGSATHTADSADLASWDLAGTAPGMQAAFGIPLGDHGVLVVGSPDALEASTMLSIELLAANATVAWDDVAAKMALQDQIDRQETVTRVSEMALENPDLNALLAEAAAAVASVLDNDYAKVLELDDHGETLLLRQGVGWDDGHVGTTTVSATEDDSQAAYTLGTEQPVVVQDLTTETRFSGPSLLTDHDVRGGISVIIGPAENPWGILGSHDTDRKEFSEQDVDFVQSVANILATAVKRHTDQRIQRRQREELAALVALSEVVRDIGGAVIEQSTRDEIESVVCERLAASDAYKFAWFGRVDHPTEVVTLTAEAGVTDYLADTSITVAPDDKHSGGPTGRAFRTGALQTWQESEAQASYEPWLEQAESYRYRASAAIPITYHETTYGVLNVYTERDQAFQDRERKVLEQLGAIVAHAIAATERKRALMTDDIVELRFQLPEFIGNLGLDPVDGSISIDDTVPVGDGEFILYGTASGDAGSWLEGIVDSLDHWDRVEYTDSVPNGPDNFELYLDQPPVVPAITAVGGSIVNVEITNGQYYLTIHVPPGDGVRCVIETVQEAYPAAEMLSRKQTMRDTGISRRNVLDIADQLTDRQLGVLRAAYQAGFFEWPRDASGEDVADSLGIAAPTFHQHLRKAQKTIFEVFLSTITS